MLTIWCIFSIFINSCYNELLLSSSIKLTRKLWLLQWPTWDIVHYYILVKTNSCTINYYKQLKITFTNGHEFLLQKKLLKKNNLLKFCQLQPQHAFHQKAAKKFFFKIRLIVTVHTKKTNTMHEFIVRTYFLRDLRKETHFRDVNDILRVPIIEKQ